MLHHSAKRLLTPPMIAGAVRYLWMEEWLWAKLTPFMAWLPVVRGTERKIAVLPPRAAVAVFFHRRSGRTGLVLSRWRAVGAVMRKRSHRLKIPVTPSN